MLLLTFEILFFHYINPSVLSRTTIPLRFCSFTTIRFIVGVSYWRHNDRTVQGDWSVEKLLKSRTVTGKSLITSPLPWIVCPYHRRQKVTWVGVDTEKPFLWSAYSTSCESPTNSSPSKLKTDTLGIFRLFCTKRNRLLIFVILKFTFMDPKEHDYPSSKKT